ncbi:hypothetical protein ACFOY4_12090 [Actinomadura syzygii]|uniref:Translation initiation factor IF-2 n=1 Tax=Actinomadura syzygii TaxID=1427538 RepID=A0A5D0U5M6_9ACTN|nr:translation initiation factor IF-2 [Actinomadura syzygii]TYC13698.1 translation initiation factor IF-2 [Actinomadura syzygii]
MRRFVIVLAGLLVAVSATGCAAVSAEGRAGDSAREKARRVGNVLNGMRAGTARDVGRRASELDGVDVLRVSGTALRSKDGVRVVVRTSGTATAGLAGDTVTVRRCFELRVAPDTEWDAKPKGKECPRGEPLSFGPWPKTPDVPAERLRKALPRVPAKARVDEAEVREAVASLRLDPAVRSEFASRDGVVGVVLSVRPYLSETFDCVLARVAPGRTDVWSPPRVQRMVGEGGCGAANAIDPMPPPH